MGKTGRNFRKSNRTDRHTLDVVWTEQNQKYKLQNTEWNRITKLYWIYNIYEECDIWRGWRAASRCHQSRIGPEPRDRHHHGDLAGGQTTHAHRGDSHHTITYTREETRKDIIHTGERRIKTSFRERDTRWGWTPAGWRTRSKTSRNGSDSREAEQVQDGFWSSKRWFRDVVRGQEERRERSSQLGRSWVCGTNRSLERCNDYQDSYNNQ